MNATCEKRLRVCQRIIITQLFFKLTRCRNPRRGEVQLQLEVGFRMLLFLIIVQVRFLGDLQVDHIFDIPNQQVAIQRSTPTFPPAIHTCSSSQFTVRNLLEHCGRRS